jgi:hypothetical protein
MSRGNRVAIMQPYFLPYLGYWQLMDCVDKFVIYDDIQFTKKGWIHRNRYFNNGCDQMFTLPLKKDSDYLDIVERELSDSWDKEQLKLVRKIEGAYKKSPYFKEGIDIVHECLSFDNKNLFEFILNSIKLVRKRLGIETELITSSEVGHTKDLIGEDRVIAVCKRLQATEYVNPIGGKNLYSKERFGEEGIDLKFHKIHDLKYDQMNCDFLPNLSILDVLMFTGIDGAKRELKNFEIQ